MRLSVCVGDNINCLVLVAPYMPMASDTRTEFNTFVSQVLSDARHTRQINRYRYILPVSVVSLTTGRYVVSNEALILVSYCSKHAKYDIHLNNHHKWCIVCYLECVSNLIYSDVTLICSQFSVGHASTFYGILSAGSDTTLSGVYQA